MGLRWQQFGPFFFSPDWHRIGIRLGCIGNVLASDWLIGQGLIFG
jgi:hypothetical protein